MQLIGLADAGASASERAPFVKALKAAQNQDGSWSQLPGVAAELDYDGITLYDPGQASGQGFGLIDVPGRKKTSRVRPSDSRLTITFPL